MLPETVSLTYIIAQIAGFVAMGFGMYSYQMKHRTGILIFQTLSNVFWLIQYLLLGRYSAVAANVIGAMRNVIYMFRGRLRFADSRLVPILATVAVVISGAITYGSPIDVLPIVAMVIASVAFYMKREQLIRILSLGIAISWFTFGLLAGSFAGMISDGVTFIVILISVIRFARASSPEPKISTDAGGANKLEADAINGDERAENGINADRCDEK